MTVDLIDCDPDEVVRAFTDDLVMGRFYPRDEAGHAVGREAWVFTGFATLEPGGFVRLHTEEIDAARVARGLAELGAPALRSYVRALGGGGIEVVAHYSGDIVLMARAGTVPEAIVLVAARAGAGDEVRALASTILHHGLGEDMP